MSSITITSAIQSILASPEAKQVKQVAAFATILGVTEATIKEGLKEAKEEQARKEAAKEAGGKLSKARLSKTLKGLLSALPEGTLLRYHEGSLQIAPPSARRRGNGIMRAIYTFDGHRLAANPEDGYKGVGSSVRPSRVGTRLMGLIEVGSAERSKSSIDSGLYASIVALGAEVRGAVSWATKLGMEEGGLHGLYEQEGMSFPSSRGGHNGPKVDTRYGRDIAVQYLARDLPDGHKRKAPLQQVVSLLGDEEE